MASAIILMTRARTNDTSNPGGKQRKVRIGSCEISLPTNRIVRISLGVGLILGGILGFLPILGFWMIPAGVVVLSADFAIMRRLRRKGEKLFRNGMKRPGNNGKGR